MAKSSINIQPVKATSETHNLRKRTYDYVRQDLTSKNYNWGFDKPLSEVYKEQQILYREKVGQKMQKKATPIREGVFLFKEDHTDEELLKVVKGVEQKFKIKAIQLSVHRDEGRWKNENGEKKWTPNYHAHVVFDWQDKKTGKSIKLNRQDMSSLQTYFSESLGMKRGIKSTKKHLGALEYKITQSRIESENWQMVIEDFKQEYKETGDQLSQLGSENHEEFKEYELLKKEIASKREKLKLAELTLKKIQNSIKIFKEKLNYNERIKLKVYDKLKNSNPSNEALFKKMEREMVSSNRNQSKGI